MRSATRGFVKGVVWAGVVMERLIAAKIAAKKN
jgi:hypothetical protein